MMVPVTVVVCMLAPSCKKEQPVNSVPVITFDSISPNPVIRLQDSVKIVIGYVDGNGDLGTDMPYVNNLFAIDSRNNDTTGFHIPQLLPSGTIATIEGNLNIILPPQYFVNSNDTTETVSYSIYLVDRAGNRSNIVRATPLVINQ